MAIRRLSKDNRLERSDRHSLATVSTLPTVKAMVDCFEKYLNLTIADGHASVDTVKTYRSRVHQFLSWCKERELYPALITQDNIKEYRKHLVDSEKTSPTIRLSLLAIKHFYTACLADKLVKDNPVVGVKAPREKREIGSTINYLSLEELQQIFNSVAPTYKIRGDKTRQVQVLRDRVLLGCMALQGCRSIEMYRANLGDVSESYGQHFLQLDGKNSIRTVVLRPDLAEEIAQYRQARRSNKEKLTFQSPLFISLSNRRYAQRLSRRGIGHVVDGYLEKCGLKHTDLERSISPHSLRHTAGTLSLQNGSSLREVQDFLGHADPKTTAVYTHVLSSQENNPAAKIEVNF
ncbi:tyrosine-type recombinase/integrase [Waterburya agarophytonicola K14]|uniref:Tyrosine-type recombinase/integrase n=1 Tax=Waterburya agarophytonicola KI4 TaxID=2874699 RepID=A0A964BTM3_9CYAN|nr:tyrosine-type recombinase/integrase [Waterburya agarophytonicola]MCC0178899.1 tyrosine-type recombinase/integrase [Waterburya agarophytonicola KI4]